MPPTREQHQREDLGRAPARVATLALGLGAGQRGGLPARTRRRRPRAARSANEQHAEHARAPSSVPCRNRAGPSTAIVPLERRAAALGGSSPRAVEVERHERSTSAATRPTTAARSGRRSGGSRGANASTSTPSDGATPKTISIGDERGVLDASGLTNVRGHRGGRSLGTPRQRRWRLGSVTPTVGQRRAPTAGLMTSSSGFGKKPSTTMQQRAAARATPPRGDRGRPHAGDRRRGVGPGHRPLVHQQDVERGEHDAERGDDARPPGVARRCRRSTRNSETNGDRPGSASDDRPATRNSPASTGATFCHAAEVGDQLRAAPGDQEAGDQEQRRRREPVVDHVERRARLRPGW